MKNVLLFLVLLLLTSCWKSNWPKQELRYGSICKDTVVTTTKTFLIDAPSQVQSVQRLCHDTIVVVDMQVLP